MFIFFSFQLSWEMLVLSKIVKKVVTILSLNFFPIFIFKNSNGIGLFPLIEYNIKNLVPQVTMWLIKRSNIA
jgi:hypothetical protein